MKWNENERQSGSGTESRVTTEWKTSFRGTRNIETGRLTFEARTAKASVSTTVSFTRETCAASSGTAAPRTAAAADGGVATAAISASCRSPSSVDDDPAGAVRREARRRPPRRHLDARLPRERVGHGLQAPAEREAAREVLPARVAAS